MNTDFEELLFSRPRFTTEFEDQTGACLTSALSPPWVLIAEPEPLIIPYPGGKLKYIPSLLISNETTRQRLAVELLSILSLSISNMVKLQHIQSTLTQAGTDFVVIVHGPTSERDKGGKRLAMYGVKATTASDSADVARKISQRLGIQDTGHAPSGHANPLR